MYSKIVNRISRRKIRNSIPEFTYGRFTNTENDIIKSNFKVLCGLCNIENEEEFVKQLRMVSNFNTPNKQRQKIVIGCFLGRDIIKPVRHGSDVFDNATKVLCGFSEGKFSKNEERLIVDEIQKNGDNLVTWKNLATKLNRDPKCHNMARQWYLMRYQMIGKRKTGLWSISEDKVLLSHLFNNKNLGINSINSFTSIDFKNIIELKRDYKSIRSHYEAAIKPVLLSYHQGLLYTDFKYEFYSYLLENKVGSQKEIQWSRVLKELPCQTKVSLNKALSKFYSDGNQTPLYEQIQDNLYRYKDHQFDNKEKEYRATIISIYTSLKQN